LIDLGAIVLVSRGAGDHAYVDGIVSALQRSSVQPPFDFNGWWRDVAQAVQAQLCFNSSSEISPDSVVRTPRSET
jgi:hypothetical protein